MVIKNETIELNIEENLVKNEISTSDDSLIFMKEFLASPIKTHLQSSEVIVRVERIDHHSLDLPTIDDQQHRKRSGKMSPVIAAKKRMTKKTDKVCSFISLSSLFPSSRQFH